MDQWPIHDLPKRGLGAEPLEGVAGEAPEAVPPESESFLSPCLTQTASNIHNQP